MVYDHELQSAKKDLEHQIHGLRGEIERAERTARTAREGLETSSREVAELAEENRLLKNRVSDLEETARSMEGRSTAELLVLASTRAAALLATVARYDEQQTVMILEAVTRSLPNRTISTNGDPYLTRWYMWPEGPRDVDDEGSDLPFAVFLHKFHRGDADRDQHNHPWDLSVAIVLAGGYREERGDEVRIVKPGDVNVIHGHDFHRVDLLNPALGSWSLFVAGRKASNWGFKDKTTGEFIPHERYPGLGRVK